MIETLDFWINNCCARLIIKYSKAYSGIFHVSFKHFYTKTKLLLTPIIIPFLNLNIFFIADSIIALQPNTPNSVGWI